MSGLCSSKCFQLLVRSVKTDAVKEMAVFWAFTPCSPVLNTELLKNYAGIFRKYSNELVG